jgi:dipeptidyl-peptidase-3
MNILAQKEKLDPAVRSKLKEYRYQLFLHHGMHDALSGQKFLPTFTQAELEAAATIAGVSIPAGLLPGIFDPKVAPTAVNKTPGKGRDPIVESAANHYEGVTSKDLEKFKEKYPLNGRVVKDKKGKLVEEVYRAGGEGAPPGLGAKEIARVVRHLEAAIPLAPPDQQASLKLLVRYLETGDNALFREHDIQWLKQSFPVDYIFGFIETFTDVRAQHANFEALITIPDPTRDPPLQALARSARYFEAKLPWRDEWKRDVFRVPAAGAGQVVAATGQAGPFVPSGVNLPNPQELRETYGTKNFLVLTAGDLGKELWGDEALKEFMPEESRAEARRCGRSTGFAATSFHEITGHGSGKINPGLADPTTLLAPYFAAMEEGRAELVAYYLMGDPKTVEIGLLPDAGCARISPQITAAFQLAGHSFVTSGDVVEEDHLRASMIALGVSLEKGVVKVERRGPKTFFIVPDPEAWRRVMGELLAEHQRIKATGDKEAMKALVDKYGTHINTAWRDEATLRLKSLRGAPLIGLIPPELKPVRDAAGAIVDVKAEPVASLDDAIAAREASWRD